MKIPSIILFSLFSLSCFSQPKTELTYKSLQSSLTEFLISNGDIRTEKIDDYRQGKSEIRLTGLFNNFQKEKLIDGIYSFAIGCSHCKAYFVIVDQSQYTILNISSKEGLNIAIQNTLDFCDRNKYCVDITKDYISRLISVYHNINKNPTAGYDANCQRGVKDTKTLP